MRRRNWVKLKNPSRHVFDMLRNTNAHVNVVGPARDAAWQQGMGERRGGFPKTIQRKVLYDMERALIAAMLAND